MGTSSLKSFIQVILSLAVALGIFWYLYQDLDVKSLQAQLLSSHWGWILCSLGIAWVGYWIRGWRWALLIQTKGEQLPVSAHRAYHAVMVGYLINLLVPRAGEVARCGVLVRNNGIPLGQGLGTVIVERSVDLLFLGATILLAFLLENQLFISLADQLLDLDQLAHQWSKHFPLLLGIGLGMGIVLFLLGKKYRKHPFLQKVFLFFRQLIAGLRFIGSLQQPLGFWISSLVIWVIYFLTMYTVSLGIESAANLSASQVLLVMVMGSIGMIAPVQGGIGTFHALVAFILIEFGVPEADGIIFAAIIHGTQVVLVVVVGLASWIMMLKLPPWKKPFTD